MIELQFPEGVDASSFLSRYWERKPLLMRGALADFDCELTPDELAGLACETDVEARIVLEKGGTHPWEVRYGPFDEATFTALPERQWTLLVQDVDKHLAPVARLLDPFVFMPQWRVDDVMVSYAADQGSVGPHFDEYNVFLFQAQGRRRWRIHTQPVSETEFIPDLDLRLLPAFEAEQEWVLEPGDVLYLPPRVAHWGIAEGECMTCSIGFRAAALRELGASWCHHVLETAVPKAAYRDPPMRTPQKCAAEIRPEAVEQIREAFSKAFQPDGPDLRRWFGCFSTEPKPHLMVYPAEPPLTPDTLLESWHERATLYRHPFSRLAFTLDVEGRDYLFANGAEYPLRTGSSALLRALTQSRTLHFGYLSEWLDDAETVNLICQLYNDGHFRFDND